LENSTRRKLAGVLGRLGSEHAGERAAAALLATRLIREAGFTWQDVLLPSDAPEQLQPQWRADLGLCQRHAADLTSWERAFLANVAGQISASQKQRDTLARVAGELRASGRS
jgi:hypothetical protein